MARLVLAFVLLAVLTGAACQNSTQQTVAAAPEFRWVDIIPHEQGIGPQKLIVQDNIAYTLNSGNFTVSSVDLASGEVIACFPMEVLPWYCFYNTASPIIRPAMDMTTDGQYLYVTAPGRLYCVEMPALELAAEHHFEVDRSELEFSPFPALVRWEAPEYAYPKSVHWRADDRRIEVYVACEGDWRHTGATAIHAFEPASLQFLERTDQPDLEPRWGTRRSWPETVESASDDGRTLKITAAQYHTSIELSGVEDARELALTGLARVLDHHVDWETEKAYLADVLGNCIRVLGLDPLAELQCIPLGLEVSSLRYDFGRDELLVHGNRCDQRIWSLDVEKGDIREIVKLHEEIFHDLTEQRMGGRSEVIRNLPFLPVDLDAGIVYVRERSYSGWVGHNLQTGELVDKLPFVQGQFGMDLETRKIIDKLDDISLSDFKEAMSHALVYHKDTDRLHYYLIGTARLHVIDLSQGVEKEVMDLTPPSADGLNLAELFPGDDHPKTTLKPFREALEVRDAKRNRIYRLPVNSQVVEIWDAAKNKRIGEMHLWLGSQGMNVVASPGASYTYLLTQTPSEMIMFSPDRDPSVLEHLAWREVSSMRFSFTPPEICVDEQAGVMMYVETQESVTLLHRYNMSSQTWDTIMFPIEARPASGLLDRFPFSYRSTRPPSPKLAINPRRSELYILPHGGSSVLVYNYARNAN